MSVKIKVSYERPDELHEVLKRLSPVIQSQKLPKGQTGRYKKAYVFLKENETEKVKRSEDEAREKVKYAKSEQRETSKNELRTNSEKTHKSCIKNTTVV